MLKKILGIVPVFQRKFFMENWYLLAIIIVPPVDQDIQVDSSYHF